MQFPHPPAPLADSVGIFDDQASLKALTNFASKLKPHLVAIDREFRKRLKSRKFDAKQVKALSAITIGEAARIIESGRTFEDFREQVEYSGRRLSKLNLPTAEANWALFQYDELLDSILPASKTPGDNFSFRPVRDRLRFAVLLWLNDAFHQVREAEAQAFYDLFRAELQAKDLDELLTQFLDNLTRISQAQAGRLFLLRPEAEDKTNRSRSWQALASVPHSEKPFPPTKVSQATLTALKKTLYIVRRQPSEKLILDKGLTGRYMSYWSIPLVSQGSMAGVIQLAFSTERSWLPRELQLLDAAVEQCLLAAEKARLVQDLAQREAQIRELGEHMWQVEEEERRRISRELHDEAGQSMLLIRLQLEMVEKAVPADLHDIRQKLRETRNVTERTIVEIRRIIAALSPAVLEQLGLSPALRQLSTRFRRLYPARVRLHLSPKLGRLPREAEIITYRLVQECYNNIAKHSSASTVNIHLSTTDTYLELRVEDDGIGFDVESALKKKDSYGLSGMRERVALLGGKFNLRSLPGRGTQISVALPI